MRSALYIKDSASLAALWAEAARKVLPAYDIVTDLEGLDLDRLEVALVWKPKPGFLASLKNLRLVVSVGAGVDHIVMSDPDFPRHIPLVRMVDPGLTQGMCDYANWACLSILRRARFLDGEQTARRWKTSPLEISETKTVAVLGLGRIGLPVAQTLQAQGFQVVGWSRSPKAVEGLKTYAGSDGLAAAVSQADMVVNLLPATAETQDLMNAEFFAQMKPGAALINAGRGATVQEEDLLKALDSGQVGEAYLDVFKVEPLPADHPFWTHPKVTLTPHIAAITHPSSGVRVLTRALEELEAGKPLSNLVDWDQGY